MPEAQEPTPYDFTDEKQVAEWARIKDRRPLQSTVAFIGPAAEHDMPCPVYPDSFAVLQCHRGVFHPSWRAQREGWRLVRARNWFQRLLLNLFFSEDPVRDAHVVRR